MSHKKNQNNVQKNRGPVALGLENLEDRRVPATGITLSAAGVLRIEGSSTNDLIQVSSLNQGTPQAIISASLKTDYGYNLFQDFDASKVTSIEVVGKGGNDTFLNTSGLLAKTSTSNGGTINNGTGGPLAETSPGVFVVAQDGQVAVDYLYRGAGYNGQVGIFSLKGMESLDPKSAAFRLEAAKRVISESVSGHLMINAWGEGAKYSDPTPWDGDMNIHKDNYVGVRTVSMTPGDKIAVMLVPNGTFYDIVANPNVDGDKQPLFSTPAANPLPDLPQFQAQAGQLDDALPVFAFEDIRLDGGSDRDYNDVVFSMLGARGHAASVKDTINPDRNFLNSDVLTDKILPDVWQEKLDWDKVHGEKFDQILGPGTFTADATGKISIDWLYDGGGFVGEMAIYALDGMTAYTPGSPEYIKEAARRALTDTTLGHVVLSDFTDGAKSSVKLATDGLFNNGTYRGIKTYQMDNFAKFGVMLIPNASIWEVYNNPAAAGAKRALFSNSMANPTQAINGGAQLADVTGNGTVFGFEDQRLDANSDRDYNDIVFRLLGATSDAVGISSVINSAKNWTKDANYANVIA